MEAVDQIEDGGHIMRRESYLTILILVAVLALAGVGTFLFGGGREAVSAQAGQNDRTLYVRGEAEISVAPDIAYVTLGVESQGPTAEAAQKQNSRSMSTVVDAITRSGIAREDLQTYGYNLFPVRTYDKAAGHDKLTGYRASNLIRVTVRHLDSVGKLIDQTVKAGATNVEGISFSVADKTQWENQAIEQAIARARAKAEVMAKASGVSLGRPTLVSDASVDVQPPVLYGQMKAAAFLAGSQDTASTPVEAGKIKVTATVQMAFEI